MDNSKLVSRSSGTVFLISIVIGILSGIFSWLFRLLIGFIHNAVFLGQFSTNYDANQHTPESYLGWLIIFAPVLGGILVVYLVKNFAPQAKGHGVPEVMNAIYHKRGIIPGSVSIVKALASAITIGTGGSLGREGPIVQISAAFSSAIGKWTRVSVSQRNLFIACGASSGIAATFNAPLGGILFSIELLLITINSRTVLAVAVSTVIAANVGHFLIGNEPAFSIPELLKMPEHGPALIPSVLSIPLGILVGLFAIVFVRSIYFSEELFEKIPVNDYVRHMIGTLILGIMFYSIYVYTGNYYVQGVGYATIQDVLMNMIQDPLFLVFLIIAKIIATGLTIGSGGSGGVFSPSLFLGAVTGALFGNLVNMLFPELGISPVIFVVVSMAAMVSATTSAPLTAAIIIYEMTLDYQAVLPIMVGVSIAYAVRRHFMAGDIYTLKLNRRGFMVPEGLVSDLKSHMAVDDVMSRSFQILSGDDQAPEDVEFICVEYEGQVKGVIDVSHDHIRSDRPLDDFKQRKYIVLEPGTTLTGAAKRFHKSRCTIGLVSTTGGTDEESIIGVVSSSLVAHAIADVTATLKGD